MTENQTPLQRVGAFLAAWEDAQPSIDSRPVGAISTLRSEGLRLTAADLHLVLDQVTYLDSRITTTTGERDDLRAKLASAMQTISRISSPTVDLIRYLPGNDSAGRLALWCTDCLADDATHAPFWTEDDAAEQVTEFCLANLVAIAEKHEREHHPDGNTANIKPDFFQPGVTYIEGRPFAAPETLSIFRCEAVATHPRAGAGLRALGFQCQANPGTNWVSAAMTISDWATGWSIYTPLGAFEQPAPAPAPHHVTVRTVRILGPKSADSDGWDDEDEATYDVEHTAQCDALPYGRSCWLDWYQTDVGTGDWPTEPGEYIATGRPEKSFNGETTEYDFYIDFEPVPAAAPEQPQ